MNAATTDLAKLEADLLAAVADATDLVTLDAVRVAAVGKQGSISALLKGMGAMSPEERKERGPLINGLRDRVQTAIAERRVALEDGALAAKLASERVDLTLPPPDRKSTRLNSSHIPLSRMPSFA